MLAKKNNLTIRNAVTTDAEQLATWWNDGKVMAHAGFPNGLGQSIESITEKIKAESNDAKRRLIIEIDGIPAGEMNYTTLEDGVVEIGIKICDFSKQDKGYGKILLSMMINSLFKDYGYKKIILDTNQENERAQHVYEKIGFTIVRVNKDAWQNQFGEYQTSIDYELIPENFNNLAE